MRDEPSSNGACRPRRGGRVAGPGRVTGIIARGETEASIGRSLNNRCYLLWLALNGSECDFDDCLVNLGRRLGWEPTDECGLSDVLAGAGGAIEAFTGGWVRLRIMAIEAYLEERGEHSVEIEAYEQRTWEEITEDTLFEDGRCIACSIGVPGGVRDHHRAAGWVAHGRTTWEEIAERVAELRRQAGMGS
jgi:hypothetical protein